MKRALEKASILFRDVGVSFASENIFSKLNFQVQAGQKLALSGPSGSGKSTILRIALGFVRPAHGEVFVHGLPLNSKNVSAIRCQSGYVPQMSSFGDGQVREALLFPFSFERNQKLRPTTEKLCEGLSRFGLSENILEKKTRELSGGERQRLAILVVRFLGRPLLLLDEVTSALDPISKEQVMQELFSEPGLTILSVSHDPDWISRCDGILEIEKIMEN